MLALLVVLAQNVPPPVAPEEPAPRRYGDRGSHHLGVTIGAGGGSGGFVWAAGVDWGYFVLDGVAPGVELMATGGSDVLTTGLTLATLRLVPVRTGSFSLTLVGRGGRVFVADHRDGWGAGGGVSVMFFTGGRIGFELGYDVLALFPREFCADLTRSCRLDGLRAGVVAGF